MQGNVYQLMDELHATLIDYYGGEFGYHMAIISQRAGNVTDEFKRFVSESLRMAIASMQDFAREINGNT